MRNNWMHFACSISFWLTILISVIPVVKDEVFKLVTPPFVTYLLGIAFPLVNAVLDEIVPKPLYKYFVIRRQDRQKAQAEQGAKGNEQKSLSVSENVIECQI